MIHFILSDLLAFSMKKGPNGMIRRVPFPSSGGLESYTLVARGIILTQSGYHKLPFIASELCFN
jgi:hypothetical protein